MLKIGVTGNNGGGKDTFANYLVSKKGFEHISLSDFIREETQKRGLELSRNNFHNVGNDMRVIFGPDILARRALEKMDGASKNYALTSIRNPYEVRALQEAGNFVLVAIDAPIEVRFARIIERNRKNEKELMTLEEFKRFEEDELKSESTSSQQIGECIKMARFTVSNDSDFAVFEKRIEEVYLRISEIFPES
jgi:dephospho-CoA kinase